MQKSYLSLQGNYQGERSTQCMVSKDHATNAYVSSEKEMLSYQSQVTHFTSLLNVQISVCSSIPQFSTVIHEIVTRLCGHLPELGILSGAVTPLAFELSSQREALFEEQRHQVA